MVVTVCSSASFYKQAVDVKTILEKAGHKVILPITAEKMKKTGDFDVSHYKTWFSDSKDYHKKSALMRKHFGEVVKADAILVLNYMKHGIANYIGGNVLMEMGLAFHFNKPIYILNELPDESPFLEEILGFTPTVLHGKLSGLTT